MYADVPAAEPAVVVVAGTAAAKLLPNAPLFNAPNVPAPIAAPPIAFCPKLG